ncbi:hypothetical protein [Micromonospora zhanjiangensis]|uniref:Uncharacterized protein n=1 Tax=Micromonospora zhanjiangensis TaxID=1522057 RepID=A0ABV8KK38_9ACTN
MLLQLVFTLVLYCLGFVFLYGVLRLAVRHGIQDVEQARRDVVLPDRPMIPAEPPYGRDDTSLAGS